MTHDRANRPERKKSKPGDMHKILFVRIGIDLFLKKIRSVEILFFIYSFILCSSLENDPLSPQKVEATQREHPPDPLFFGIYFNLIRSYRNRGDAKAAGAEA